MHSTTMHVHVERRNSKGYWDHLPYLSGAQFQDCSDLFAHLAGVQNAELVTPLADPRGRPTGGKDDISYPVYHALYESGPSPIWPKDDECITSWLTLEELQDDRVSWEMLPDGSGAEFMDKVINRLRHLTDKPSNIRIIFRFEGYTIAHLEADAGEGVL